MVTEHIAIYLNDHLAGAAAGLELLEHLEAGQLGTPGGQALAALRAEIVADRQALESLMARLGVKESRTRKASAWLAEKAAELKLFLDDKAGGAFWRFEALEALSLGIEGKRALWLALAAGAEEEPTLRGALDYALMARRAEGQRSQVEAMRLATAKEALSPSG